MFSFLKGLFLSETREECLEALEDIDPLFSDEAAYARIRMRVRKIIQFHHAQNDHLLDYMNNEGYTPKQKVLYLIEEVVLEQLSTGYYHEKKAELTPEGESLCRIYRSATEGLVRCSHYTAKDLEERFRLLDEKIKAGGHDD